MGSDRGGLKGGDLSGTEFAHRLDHTHHVLAAVEIGNKSLADVSVLAIGVLNGGGDLGEQSEVSICCLRAAHSGATIGPACVELVDVGVKHSDNGLFLLCSGIILHDSAKLGLLQAVLDSGKEPLGLVGRFCGGGCITILVSKHPQDGGALIVVLAVVSDPDGQRGLAVSASGLHGAPLSKSDSRILEGDALDAEQVADSLGAALEWEINELGHTF